MSFEQCAVSTCTDCWHIACPSPRRRHEIAGFLDAFCNIYDAQEKGMMSGYQAGCGMEISAGKEMLKAASDLWVAPTFEPMCSLPF